MRRGSVQATRMRRLSRLGSVPIEMANTSHIAEATCRLTHPGLSCLACLSSIELPVYEVCAC